MPTGFDNVPNVGQQLTDNLVGGNVAGIFSTRPSAKYVSGARCVLRINGKPVAFAFSVSWRIDTLYTEINAIDNPLPEELVPRAIKVSGSIAALHIPGQGPTAKLWQPDVLSFLFHQYITIEVRDSATGQLLFYTSKAVINSRQEEIRVEELAQVNLSFQAIGFKDEREPEIPRAALTQSKEVKSGDFNTEPKTLKQQASGLIDNISNNPIGSLFG